MPSSSKKFRILRSVAGKFSDTLEPANRSGTEPAGDLSSRIGAAVRNRVANSLSEEREVRVAGVEPEDHDSERFEEIEMPEVVETPERILSPREEIEAIKQENLTGRQLRIARRLAQKHGIHPTSDLDAVRLLRNRGIDPFNRGEMMEIGGAAGGQTVALPATVRKSQAADPAPQPPIIDDDTREREVRKIQLDLVKRRRKRLAVLFVKLACYVALPSLLAGFYYYRVATPMYATYTEFVIQTSEAPGSAGGGGFFAGSPFATATDSITVQGYLTSRDAMLRLNDNPGFRSFFEGDKVDVLQRLDAEASNEEAYGVYKKKIIIGFDPTEGVIKMEVITPTPESSLEISRALIGYAEEQVDSLTERKRSDQMRGAEDSYEASEIKMELALERMSDLQRQLNTFDPNASFSLLMTQIGSLEDQILQKQLELSQLLDNARPNRTKLRVLEREIELLELKLHEKQSLVTQGNTDKNSIVNINAELTKAQTNLALRQELLAVSLQNLEAARVEANRQTRYLSMGVSPVQPDRASYPRAFENTLLAIVIFAGIYLMISLTVSILREQVST
ncbi:MAG: capsule biosynthesis protein [Rhodobacteraceae bacterium]|nr:capsule biosynthesis protein [Paracoccaceae bacterium]